MKFANGKIMKTNETKSLSLKISIILKYLKPDGKRKEEKLPIKEWNSNINIDS